MAQRWKSNQCRETSAIVDKDDEDDDNDDNDDNDNNNNIRLFTYSCSLNEDAGNEVKGNGHETPCMFGAAQH